MQYLTIPFVIVLLTLFMKIAIAINAMIQCFIIQDAIPQRDAHILIDIIIPLIYNAMNVRRDIIEIQIANADFVQMIYRIAINAI